MPGARIGSSGPFATSDDIANASGVAGVDVTAALDALAAAVAALQPAPIASQIGWTPPTGTSSNVLTLVAAGHPPGLYDISWTAIIRTTGTGSALGNTLTWHSPAGAESRALASSTSWAALGTIVTGAGNALASPRKIAVYSDGTADIALQFTAGAISAGNPVADLYASARLIAA